MAGQVWPVSGAAEMLTAMLGGPVSGISALELMLWRNDREPTRKTVLADLTECDFDGYFRKPLESELWEPLPPDEFDRALAWYNGLPLAWTAGAGTGNTVYGWAVVNPISGAVWWVERFDAPKPMATAGDFLQIVLQQRLTSEIPPMPPPS